MITPAYALTATERVLPRLALDFTTASLDPRVTITRALNTATRINSSGLVEIVNADLPRFDYDPLTGACRGLLIEESRQNIQLQSEDFATTWSTTTINVSTNSIAAPDGNLTADTLTATATPGNIVYLQPVANGTTYTFSVFVKKLTSDTVQINFANVAAGPVFTFSTETFSTVASWTTSVQKLGAGWYRITATRASNTIFAGMQIRIANSGEAIYAWGAQMEAGAFATSYIPTTTTSVTRNADVVTMTGANFSSWYNASEGAFVASGEVISASTQSTLLNVSDAGTGLTERMQLRVSAGAMGFINSVGGSPTANMSNGSITSNTVFKAAVAYKLNSFALSANATSPALDNLGAVAAPVEFRIGRLGAATEILNGRIRNIYYYPQRILNAETQAFSK